MSPAAAASTSAPSRDWEAWLATASGPASPTEEDQRNRTESRIRDAIARAPDIPSSVRVYAKGSYANNTNVRRDADVDVAVEWIEQFKVMTWGKTEGMTAEQLGYIPVFDMISPAEFRRRVEQAVIDAFSPSAVDTTPDKHIGVAAGTNTLDADVVPCIQLNRYDDVGVCVVGHRIFPKSGAAPVDNYPQQNYDNGVAKNNSTSRRYKEIVRCVKRLVAELYDERIIPRDYPGYLLECLLYNVPNDYFGHARRYDDMQAVLRHLWSGLGSEDTYLEWTEPSELLMLFRGRPDRIPENARNVIEKAWQRIGITSA
jgi:hypothetical protein